MGAAAHGRHNRVFHYALLASIALHGLLLLALPGLRDSSRRVQMWPGPLVARLVQPAQEPPAAKPEPVTPQPPPALKPAVKPAPSPKPAPVAKEEPKAPAQAAAPAPPPVPAPASAAAAVHGAAAAGATATPAARPGTDVEADTIGRFRMQVIEAARRFNQYPRAARENNWQGRVDVRLSFSAGRRTATVVARSSGYVVLDRQAVDTLSQAEVPVPPALRAKEFAFVIPVLYNLEESQ